MKFKDLNPGAHFWVKDKPSERFLKIHPMVDKEDNCWNACDAAGFGEEFTDDQEVVDLQIGQFEDTQNLEAVQREIVRLQEVVKAYESLQNK